MSEKFTVGPLAIRLGCLPHHLIRLAKKAKIPHERLGRLHVFAEKDLPAIREQLVKAGIIKETGHVACV